MLTLPVELSRRYETLLKAQGVASQHGSPYAKWLRYYWDFCQKDGFELNDQQSVPPFGEKLRIKNQSEFQRPRAQRRAHPRFAP